MGVSLSARILEMSFGQAMYHSNRSVVSRLTRICRLGKQDDERFVESLECSIVAEERGVYGS
jgi:hypothetical protein